MISECEISMSQALLDSAREIFETMVYMSAEESDISQLAEDCECINASILFKGSISGGMVISCPVDCARAITASMLAMDGNDNITKSDVIDAMSELANLVMGSVKTKVYDTYGDIKVSIPSILEAGQEKLSHGSRNSELFLSIDDESPCRNA